MSHCTWFGSHSFYLLLQDWQGRSLLEFGIVKRKARLIVLWLWLHGWMFSLPTKSFWAGNHSPHPSELVQGHQDSGIRKEGIFTIQFRDSKWITIFIPHETIAFKYKVLQWIMPMALKAGSLWVSVCCCLFAYLSKWKFGVYSKGSELWNICDHLKHETVEKCWARPHPTARRFLNVHTCSCVHVVANVNFLQLLSTSFSEIKSLTKLREPLILLNWLANKPQRSSFLHLPTPKITGTCHCARLLQCEFCLCGKYFGNKSSPQPTKFFLMYILTLLLLISFL